MVKKQLTPDGLKIKKKLAEKNMTLYDLAEAVGANENYLSQIIHGHKPGYKYIDSISFVLGIKFKSEKRC